LRKTSNVQYPRPKIITRDLLSTGTLRRYIDELSVTGLTSNPTIFDHAIKNSSAYAAAKAFSKSWNDLMSVIASTTETLRMAA